MLRKILDVPGSVLCPRDKIGNSQSKHNTSDFRMSLSNVISTLIGIGTWKKKSENH